MLLIGVPPGKVQSENEVCIMRYAKALYQSSEVQAEVPVRKKRRIISAHSYVRALIVRCGNAVARVAALGIP